MTTPRRKKIKLWKRTCPNCKRIHFVTDYKKTFCSDKCRKISDRIRKKKPQNKKICRWCGKEFNPEELGFHKSRCYCCDEHKAEASKVAAKKYQRRVRELNQPVEKLVKCKCLKCEQNGRTPYHYKKMYYTGSQKVPYFFCEDCSKENEFIASEEPLYTVGINVVRMGLLF